MDSPFDGHGFATKGNLMVATVLPVATWRVSSRAVPVAKAKYFSHLERKIRKVLGDLPGLARPIFPEFVIRHNIMSKSGSHFD